MNGLVNLDLLSVGVAVAAVIVLGFAVFFANRKSTTNRVFLIFAIAATLWSVSNYFLNQLSGPSIALIATRVHMFFAVWYSFGLFNLFYVFPGEHIAFSRHYKFTLIPLVGLVSLMSLTPFVLSQVTQATPAGEVPLIAPGMGIVLFGITVVALIGSGLFILFRKLMRSTGIVRVQLKYVLTGASITFCLHLLFNFIFPIILKDTRFVPLGATFTFPFVVLTSYAIVRHHLLNVKVVTTEILTFLLAIITFVEVVIAKDIYTSIFRSAVFILVLSFGILLIKSVLKEVEQREKLQELTEKLEVTNAKLEDLSRFKTQLLSLASHQVKSPLTVIKGFTDLLREGLYGPMPPQAQETLGKIDKSARDLIALINTLLDLRKVEEGKMDYQFTPTDFTALVKEVCEGLRSLADAKKLVFECALGDVPVMVSADAVKLKQVIQNLVDNAIKYTLQGSVAVSVEKKDSYVTFSVRDTGLGISAELLPNLFEEFVRGTAVKVKILGTGLGLYIARKIVEAHGGTLAAASEGEGRGSTFSVRLPIAKG